MLTRFLVLSSRYQNNNDAIFKHWKESPCTLPKLAANVHLILAFSPWMPASCRRAVCIPDPSLGSCVLAAFQINSIWQFSIESRMRDSEIMQ